jgi:hypothetical protein
MVRSRASLFLFGAAVAGAACSSSKSDPLGGSRGARGSDVSADAPDSSSASRSPSSGSPSPGSSSPGSSSLDSSSGTSDAPSGASGTVSVASLSAINTSASPAFTDVYKNYITGTIGTPGMPLTNADALPTNVSNVSVHTLLPNHPNEKIYVETQDWFWHVAANEVNGKLIPNAEYYQSIDVGYDSADNAAAQVDDMVRRGIDGATVDWYGPGLKGDEALANLLKRSEEAYGGAFQVSVDIDHGAFGNPPAPCNNMDANDTATCFVDYIAAQYTSSPAYMRINGKLAVFWFITQQAIDSAIDWVSLKAHTNSLGMTMILENPWSGFNFYNGDGFSDGAYAWVSPDGTSGINYLNTQFYPTANQYPNEIAIGGAWRGFDDVAASWTQNGQMPTKCGDAWFDTFADNDAQSNLSGIMIATWDDYAEGSEVETGIDNCLSSVNVSVSGGSLTWTSNFGSDPWSGVTGSERSLDHYEIWASSDNGQTAVLAAQANPTGGGAGSIAIASLNIGSGNYQVFVRAVGKASIQNHTSAGVSLSK